MPLGKFQEDLRLCEGVSLGEAQIGAFLANPARYSYVMPTVAPSMRNQLTASVVRALRFSYEDASRAASFLSLATAEGVSS